jgi:hypothetical protein
VVGNTHKVLTPLKGVLKRVPAFFPFTGVITLEGFSYFVKNFHKGIWLPFRGVNISTASCTLCQTGNVQETG